MSVQNVKNTPVNWHNIVANVQGGLKTMKNKKTAAPHAPSSSPPAIPARKAPKASDSEQVKAGLENVNRTKLLFSIELLVSLLFKLAMDQSSARRASRMQDATTAEEMGEAAASDLRDEAVMAVTGAVVSSTAQIAGAGTMIGGGIRTAKMDNVMEVSNKMMTYQAVDQTFGAMGKTSQGGFDYQSKEDEAQKALDDSAASQAKSLEESDADDEKDEMQVVQSIIQLEQQMEETRHEAMRATA